MPSYLYACSNENCVGEFERFHSIMIKLEECPICAEAGRGAQLITRLINGGGSGRGIVSQTTAEIKEGMSGEVAKMHARAGRDTNYLANIVGEKSFEKKNPRGY